MNIKLIKKVYRAIKEAPAEKTNMHEWRCGTAFCIGGWALHLSGKYVYLEGNDNEASALLELTPMQSAKLFYTVGWFKRYRKLFNKADTLEERKQAVLLYIKYFVKKYTGVVL